MSSKSSGLLTVVCLVSFALAVLCWAPKAIAGEFVEEFDGNVLNEDIWEMRAEAGASYKIENGTLTMTSPGVSDGILMYWKGDVDSADFTVEIKATVAPNTNNAAVIAFLDQDLPPTLNSTINPEWMGMVWCGANTPGWYINDDNWTNTGVKGPELEGIWKAEIKGNKIHFSFNGQEAVVVDKVAEDRFLCFGPDTYTSHYSGEMAIDWIKVSGATITAVEPTRKLPVMWGELRSRF